MNPASIILVSAPVHVYTIVCTNYYLELAHKRDLKFGAFNPKRPAMQPHENHCFEEGNQGFRI